MNTENLKTLKYPIFPIKREFSLLFVISGAVEDEKILKEEKSIEVLKIPSLINKHE